MNKYIKYISEKNETTDTLLENIATNFHIGNEHNLSSVLGTANYLRPNINSCI